MLVAPYNLGCNSAYLSMIALLLNVRVVMIAMGTMKLYIRLTELGIYLKLGIYLQFTDFTELLKFRNLNAILNTSMVFTKKGKWCKNFTGNKMGIFTLPFGIKCIIFTRYLFSSIPWAMFPISIHFFFAIFSGTFTWTAPNKKVFN